MTQKIKIIIGIAILAVIIAGATIVYNALGSQITPENNIELAESKGVVSDNENSGKQKASDFTMTDEDGNSIKLSDLIANNKPIVLNFWASWCPPCKSEMPEFDTVYKELGNEIQFVMLDLTDGQRETIEEGSKYVKEQGFLFPVYFDTNQEGAYAYGIRAIPTTLFIGKDGYIVTEFQGAIDEDTLRKSIDMIK